MLLGVWIAIFLFLGFPSAWEELLAVVSGIVIIGIAYRMVPEVKISAGQEAHKDIPYVEHKADTITSVTS